LEFGQAAKLFDTPGGPNLLAARPFVLARPLKARTLSPPISRASLNWTQSVPEVLRATLPVIAVLSPGVLLITCAPWLTTLLPKLID